MPIFIKLGVALAVDPKGHFVGAAPPALPFSALPSKGSRLR
ncbi:hypothetical protein [Thermostichus sp. MS-CIW-37]